MSDVIPTAEDAASALNELQYENYVVNPRLTLAIVGPIARPLLEAIAEGRVFEVRRELCTECDGVGGFEWIDDHDTGTDTCPRCDGSGCEPVPPGRKQRTAYDAMIEAAAEGGA